MSPRTTQCDAFIVKQQTDTHDVKDINKLVRRHPRWTHRETMILIEGKKVAEDRARTKSQRSDGVLSPKKPELKWDSVSTYCRRNGVNRGPVQCRKRWSNLVCEFKKIKTWELLESKESYWTMRSDSRRERKLPRFFDREVYHVLDGNDAKTGYELALVTTTNDHVDDENISSDGIDDESQETLFQQFEDGVEKEDDEEEEKGIKHDKTRTIPSPVPISEMKCPTYFQTHSYSGVGSKRPPSPYNYSCRDSEFQDRVKIRRRKRQTTSECPNIDLVNHLVRAVERNHSLLKDWIEFQKTNYQLEREQRKEQNENLQTALTKISDALEIIANNTVSNGK